eukprot:scaffold118228_cov69-Phaeocystis_antarctica.AAC.3
MPAIRLQPAGLTDALARIGQRNRQTIGPHEVQLRAPRVPIGLHHEWVWEGDLGAACTFSSKQYRLRVAAASTGRWIPASGAGRSSEPVCSRISIT